MSTDIHVPSLVVKSIVRVTPRGCDTSHADAGWASIGGAASTSRSARFGNVARVGTHDDAPHGVRTMVRADGFIVPRPPTSGRWSLDRAFRLFRWGSAGTRRS